MKLAAKTSLPLPPATRAPVPVRVQRLQADKLIVTAIHCNAM
jgi:hypothetical protein